MEVVVSIHDVTPLFQNEVDILLNKLVDIPTALLITPNWHENNKITTQFCNTLGDDEKVLHGLTHTGKPDRYSSFLFRNENLRREFKGIAQEETCDKLRDGIKAFEDNIGLTPKGFVPPMWYHNEYSMGLLKKLRFDYTEQWLSFYNLKNDNQKRGLPMSFDYGDNYTLARLCLWYSRIRIQMHQRFIRFAIHPQDLQHGFLCDILDRIQMLKDKGYDFITYQKLMSSP